MTPPDKLAIDDISYRISVLRKDIRTMFGGIIYKNISADFGIYKMNIADNESFERYAEYHLVELEKMFIALKSSNSQH